jgi:phospholipid/cholesterol/gamma-HCH transport system permease protein
MSRINQIESDSRRFLLHGLGAPGAETGHPPEAVVQSAANRKTVKLTGHWTLRGFSDRGTSEQNRLRQMLAIHARDSAVHWDLYGVQAIDSVGAFFLSRSWRNKRPEHLVIRDKHNPVLKRWLERQVSANTGQSPAKRPWPLRLAHRVREQLRYQLDFIRLFGQFVLDSLLLLRHPGRIPWREISATVYESGGRALTVTALVGVLIGVVVSMWSALELRNFGAEAYIVNILGISILRELGPLLAAIIVAGRSGSAMTAELGVMRLTQELDALSSIGISPSIRLILPMIVGLTIAMPLLVVWTDTIALAGGIFVAHVVLGINSGEFLESLPHVVPIVNFWLGLGKALVFGFLIAMVSGHFGLRIEPNTQSLGRETTNAVVNAITMVIAADAVFALLLQDVGLPGAS